MYYRLTFRFLLVAVLVFCVVLPTLAIGKHEDTLEDLLACMEPTALRAALAKTSEKYKDASKNLQLAKRQANGTVTSSPPSTTTIEVPPTTTTVTDDNGGDGGLPTSTTDAPPVNTDVPPTTTDTPPPATTDILPTSSDVPPPPAITTDAPPVISDSTTFDIPSSTSVPASTDVLPTEAPTKTDVPIPETTEEPTTTLAPPSNSTFTFTTPSVTSISESSSTSETSSTSNAESTTPSTSNSHIRTTLITSAKSVYTIASTSTITLPGGERSTVTDITVIVPTPPPQPDTVNTEPASVTTGQPSLHSNAASPIYNPAQNSLFAALAVFGYLGFIAI